MEIQRRQFLHLVAGAAALPAISSIARAQTYPSRPITIVAPYAAGGATDTIARVMAERMKSSLGQPVIVEDVTGAGGTIAVGRVARAAPDGYTLGLGDIGSHVVTGATYALRYDLLNDFVPVALISSAPFVLVANKMMPANDLKGLIAWLKANPDKAVSGHGGNGGSGHVASVVFRNETGTRFQLVPYRGAAPAIQDLVAGQIDMAIVDPVVSLPQVRAGTIKAYGVTTKTRLLSAPDIPTLDEAGLPGFDISQWHGLWLPKGTLKKNIITKINAAVMEAVADPKVQARLADLGQEIFPRDRQTPERLGAFQKAEIEKWWPIIKEAGIKAE
jgi:tripartite-type tricarboxylate transporter receptor subunit TctC